MLSTKMRCSVPWSKQRRVAPASAGGNAANGGTTSPHNNNHRLTSNGKEMRMDYLPGISPTRPFNKDGVWMTRDEAVAIGLDSDCKHAVLDEESFFIIKYSNEDDHYVASEFLSEYDVTVMEVGKDIIVHGDGEDFRLAEMCFQMNFHQAGNKACPICAAVGKLFCGHLVFTRQI